ncbi:MAG: TATA-box-binding protein [Candidatus Altiarchaeales archaeon]|nr:TATA-box-binding protein [Candidatus Altiarchaeales archaeon]MBD3416854.1 TATA-box-binding protein [Candidatus Altiarchaeales archaeon]
MAVPVKIENIVSAITLGIRIDLRKFVDKVRGVEYNPENFPGVVYRVHEPKVSMLIFSSGKVICTGARGEEDIDAAVDQLKVKLGEGGVRVKGAPVIEIQNIVASSSVDVKVNLDQLAIECFNTEYEPEQFPGLVYRLEQPKTVMLIFRSGKMIITGAKNTEDIRVAAEKTRDMIHEYKAIIE